MRRPAGFESAAIRILVAGVVLALAGGTPPARGQAPDASGESLVEDNDGALAVLEEAGVPPTSREIHRALDAAAARPTGISGLWRTRCGWSDGEWTDLAGRFEFERGPLWGRARVRRGRDGLADRVAVTGIQGQRGTFLVGRLGMRLGFGLAAAGPGRSSSLAADASLGMSRSGPVAWTGTPDERTRLGVGGELAGSSWRVGFMGGRHEGGGSRDVGGALRIQGRSGHGRLGVMIVAEGPDAAGGITGTITRGDLTLWGEGVGWRTGGPGLTPWGLHLAARWRPGKRLLVEAAWAAAALPTSWGAGVRSPLLPGDRGRGFAVRLRIRTADGLVLRALAHEGIAEASRADGDPARRRLLELQAENRWAGEFSALVRVRRWSRTVWSFSTRHPWLPPEPETSGLKTVYGLRVRRERDAWRTSFLLRSLGRETPGRPGRRTLLSAAIRWRHRTGWRARGFVTTAWGDDVDLVSAIVPVDGVILPRHWGRWRSGVGGGVGWAGAQLKIEAAVGGRRPEPGRGERPEVWARFCGQWRW